MRIIAGEYRGRRLKTLRGRQVRPTSDKLRETLFNVLQAEIADSVFIDCYAGSGAVGLEAFSRGAEQVYVIERDPAAARVMEENRDSLGCGKVVRILRADVQRSLQKLDMEGVRADICFMDPPYSLLGDALKVLSWLCGGSLMKPTGVIVLEHDRKDSTPEGIAAWRRARLLQQGSSALSFYRRNQ